MKATWLRDFASALEDLSYNLENVLEVFLHYRNGELWSCTNASASSPVELLDKTLASGVVQKIGKNNRYFFPVQEVRAVVEIRLVRYAKASTIQALTSNIERIKETSQHKHDAHHDSLTGCRNRKSFEIAAREAIDKLGVGGTGRPSSINASWTRAVALVTLDIDYFKRVNDTYGHDYGDIVLSAFAWQIEDAITDLRDEAKRASFELFRLGGEEFNIIVAGEFEDRDLLDWIERIRLKIKGSIIPSNEQVAKLESALAPDLPPERERRITASFGVSKYSANKSSTFGAKVIENLKVQADKALYAAKNSGRDCVRFFPDIVKRYGRVLEHDRSVNIIVTDIGSEVGVSRGQEFFVIPPKFTGDVDYVVDDGRSRRKLGRYPKRRVARLTTFDVQPEISFCKITEQLDGTSLEVGSYLELIPVGLFSGLVGQHGDDGPERESTNIISERIEAHSTERLSVLAVQIRELDELERRAGPARVNDLLASVSTVVSKVLARKAKLLHTELGVFGAVLVDPPADRSSLIDSIKRELDVLCEGLAQFAIGYVDKGSLEIASLPLENAWEYAVLAAAAAPPGNAEVFSMDLPLVVLENQQSAGQFEQVLLDYERFKSLGIAGAPYDNLAGIANAILGREVQADLSFTSAYNADPKQAAYCFNLAYTRMVLHKYKDAYEYAVKSIELEAPNTDDERVITIAAYSAYMLWKAREINIGPEPIIDLLQKACGQPDNQLVPMERLAAALEDMKSRREQPEQPSQLGSDDPQA